MAASNYGRFFYSVETPTDVEMVHADRATVESGCLLLWGAFKGGEEQLNIAYAPGSWLRFAAASVIDGYPVAIDSINPKPSTKKK